MPARACDRLLSACKCRACGEGLITSAKGAGFNPASTIGSRCTVKPSSRDRRSCLLDDGLERGGLLDCKIGQHFPIDQNSGLAYAVDEATVGEAKWAHRGIETLNP